MKTKTILSFATALAFALTLAITVLAPVTPAFAQQGQLVRIVADPEPDAVQLVAVINGSNQIASICKARSTVTTGQRAATQVAISAVSKAAAAVVTSTAHGFDTNSAPRVTISGATGTGWTGINGTFTATIIDADTFSIPVNSSGFGTLAGTVVFTTTAPRKTMYEWAIQQYSYDASGNFVWSGWLGGSTSYSYRCSDAAVAGVSKQ